MKSDGLKGAIVPFCGPPKAWQHLHSMLLSAWGENKPSNQSNDHRSGKQYASKRPPLASLSRFERAHVPPCRMQNRRCFLQLRKVQLHVKTARTPNFAGEMIVSTKAMHLCSYRVQSSNDIFIVALASNSAADALPLSLPL